MGVIDPLRSEGREGGTQGWVGASENWAKMKVPAGWCGRANQNQIGQSDGEILQISIQRTVESYQNSRIVGPELDIIETKSKFYEREFEPWQACERPRGDKTRINGEG